MSEIDAGGRILPRTLAVRRIRLRKRGYFLKGPIPLPWVETAAKLPGKSLHAGIAIWYAPDLACSLSVPLCNISAGDRFGLTRNAKYRALRWLETAGLILVEEKSAALQLLPFFKTEARVMAGHRKPGIEPRIIRFRDASHYLGMDRNRFNAEVRPYLTEVPIGSQGIGFDRLELDSLVRGL